jgi:hypothetical protein
MSDSYQEEIDRLTQEIDILRKKRGKLLREQQYNKQMIKYDPLVEELAIFLRANPGSTRQQISTLFPDLDYREFSKLLLAARRNRGLIENRGTRANPLWYAI